MVGLDPWDAWPCLFPCFIGRLSLCFDFFSSDNQFLHLGL